MHVAVVGGGVIGLLTAVECTLAGHRVTLVEQDALPSPSATSFDRHRMLRALHVGDRARTVAAVRAHHRWVELERILLRRFYDRVGALTGLPRDTLPEALSTLWNSGARARVLDPDALKRDYPHLSFGQAHAVLEDTAGVLLANRVLTACVDWLKAQPQVTLRPHTRATRVDPDLPAVRLADGSTVRADGLVAAAGPWSPALVDDPDGRRLRLHRQSVLYCTIPATTPAADQRRWAATPAVPSLATPTGAWLVPPVAGTPLKLSASSACRVVDEVTDRDTAPHWLAHLIEVFADAVPGFDGRWVSVARDAYYLADIDAAGGTVVPLGPRAIAFTACGGGSFKFAPNIARSLVGHIDSECTAADPELAPAAVGPSPERNAGREAVGA